MRRLRAVMTALAIAAPILLSTVAPHALAEDGPLPVCVIDDVLTEPRGYDDWRTTLVDWTYSVGRDYKPPDLVSVRNGGVAGGGYIRRLAVDDLRAMAQAAEANGTPLVAWSPYRSFRQQKKLFGGYARGDGFDVAITYSARPGHSEHQLGLTIDFVAVGDTGLSRQWEKTQTGAWMAKNAWKYGWIMSYPKGKQAVVCYSYEPWHYRYVGRELARAIHDSGQTFREYVWEHGGEPIPTGAAPTKPSAIPSTIPSPSAVPSEPAEASPSPDATGLATFTLAPVDNDTRSFPPDSPSAPPSGGPVQASIDPPLLIAGALLVVAVIGLVASLGFLRRSNRRPSRG